MMANHIHSRMKSLRIFLVFRHKLKDLPSHPVKYNELLLSFNTIITTMCTIRGRHFCGKFMFKTELIASILPDKHHVHLWKEWISCKNWAMNLMMFLVYLHVFYQHKTCPVWWRLHTRMNHYKNLCQWRKHQFSVDCTKYLILHPIEGIKMWINHIPLCQTFSFDF